jgi:ADP-ribosylglycohydrolase
MKRKQEHYRGCLIGGAIGDAFGSAVEFLSIDAIKEKYGEAGITDLVCA